MAGWPCRGAPRGLGRMSARSVALTLAVVLATARPAATRSGEDFLSAALLPSAAPAVAGASVTVVGLNFNPGGVFDALDDDPSHPDDPDLGAARGMACVFAGFEGPAGITPARVDSTGVFACAAPPGVPHGFLGVGVSGNGGVDARFFHADDAVVHFSPPGEVRAALGPGLWSRGDPVTLAGRDMLPRSARDASPGELVLCGWTDDDRAGGSAAAEPAPGVFVSSAIRRCETPATIPRTPTRIVAVADAEGFGEGESTLSGGIAVTVAEPPAATGVNPSATIADGGVAVTAATTGGFGRDAGFPATHLGPLARVGTVRVAMDPAGEDSGEGRRAWRFVSPARAPDVPGKSPTVAVVATHFGAEPVPSSPPTLAYVPALRAAVEALDVLDDATWRVQPWTIAGAPAAAAGFRVASLASTFPTVAAFRWMSTATTKSTGTDDGASSSTVIAAFPEQGPAGGGALVWIAGTSLDAPCALVKDATSVVYDSERTSDASRFRFSLGTLVSSAVAACEAPPGAGAFLAAVVSPGASGAGTYAYHAPVGFPAVANPAHGPTRGGTSVSVPVPARARPGACRFGAVTVRASVEERASRDGGRWVRCVVPAGRPGKVEVAVAGAAGGACDASGYELVDGPFARHRLDDADG